MVLEPQDALWHSRPAHRTQIRPGGCATLQHAAWKHCMVTSEPTRSRSRWTRCRREISKATNATCHKKRGAASSSSNRPTRKTHTVSAPRATARASGITCVLLGPGPHRDRGGRCFVLPGRGFREVAGLQVYGGRPCAGAGSDVRRLHAAMTFDQSLAKPRPPAPNARGYWASKATTSMSGSACCRCACRAVNCDSHAVSSLPK